MPRHAVLVLPAANRVYAMSAPEIAVAELGALDRLASGGRWRDVAVEPIAGLPYVTFDGEMDDTSRVVLGAHSLAYAAFERDGDRLRPVALVTPDRLPDDLLTIQRYTGRTNERFTRLLVNLAGAAAAGAAAFDGRSKLRLLDPVCGRGTTLHQALTYGWDAAGVEIDRRDVDAWAGFFTTWLEGKRMPHRRDGRRNPAVTFSVDRAAQKAGIEQRVEVVCDDTLLAGSHFGKRSFDVVVGDLPYGVQHGARSSGRVTRDPAALLGEALPVWRSLLRPGGACVLAWNRKLLPRAAMEELVVRAALETVDLPGGADRFAHRVDHAVERDVVVARRPG